MSYVSQAQDPRRRAGALAGTVAINAAIGLAVVTGLTMTGFRAEPDTYKPIITIKTPPPPKPPEPKPTEPAEFVAPKPTAPMPPIELPPAPGPAREVFDPDANLVTEVTRIPEPGPSIVPTPRPAPGFTPKAARPSNDSSRWITTNDYPRRSLLDGNEGTARYRLVIGTTGQVASCEVTTSTGDRQLDQATCRHLTRRAQFEAATDENGAKVMGTYTGSVRWEIPE